MANKFLTKEIILPIMAVLITLLGLYSMLNTQDTVMLNMQKMKIREIERMYAGDSTTIIYDYVGILFDTNIIIHKHVRMTSPFSSHWYVDSTPRAIDFCKEHITFHETNKYSEIESCINLTYIDSTYYIFDSLISRKEKIYDENKVRVPFNKLKFIPTIKGIIVDLISVDGKIEYLGYIGADVSPTMMKKEWILFKPHNHNSTNK